MRASGPYRVALLACLAAAGGACAGATNSDGIPRARIESELHAAFCRWEVRCEQLPDVATCLANTSLPLAPVILAHVTSGRMVYEPVGGRELIDYWDALGCLRSENETFEVQRKMARAQLAAFRGNAPVGRACLISEDCAEALCRRTCTQACCEGTCEARRPVARRGEECNAGVVDCEDDSFCGAADPATLKRTCVARKALGATCAPADPAYRSCEYGTSCQLVSDVLGTCQEYPASGATCVLGPCDDLRDACAPGLTSSTCQRRLPAGADCTIDGLPCNASAVCDAPTGKCRLRAPSGAACEPRQGGDCLGDRQCDPAAKTCGPPPVTQVCQ